MRNYGGLAALYFVQIIIIGDWMLLNLFLSILMQKMDEVTEEAKKIEMKVADEAVSLSSFSEDISEDTARNR